MHLSICVNRCMYVYVCRYVRHNVVANFSGHNVEPDAPTGIDDGAEPPTPQQADAQNEPEDIRTPEDPVDNSAIPNVAATPNVSQAETPRAAAPTQSRNSHLSQRRNTRSEYYQ